MATVIAAINAKLLPIGSLRPATRNPNRHSKGQIEQIATSIRRFGFNNPIVATPGGEIVAGEGRWRAAQALGMPEVPVVLLDHLPDAAQRRAYLLADNQIARNSSWDREMLALEASELKGLDVDLGALGFDRKEIDRLLAHALSRDSATQEGPQPNDDAAIAPLQGIITRQGDIWHLGQHRLACGDSTDPAIVGALLAGDVPVLMVTDPPYGHDYDPTWRAKRLPSHGVGSHGLVANDTISSWGAAYRLFAGAAAYVWHSALHCRDVADDLETAGLSIRQQIVWAKHVLTIGRSHYHWQHEVAWYAARDGAPWHGDRKQSTVWSIASNSGGNAPETRHGHSTQKPVECMARAIRNSSLPGQLVYDPFCGSGTTIIAAHRLGRIARAVELMPEYVDMTVRRWQGIAGAAAVRAADGLTFGEAEAVAARAVA